MTREPSPLHARAAHPDCPACGGTGRVHIQHKRPFRVESRECECWKLAASAKPGTFAATPFLELVERASLQGEAP